jgi:nucleoside-diphosphate-sugar epimerase
MGETGSWSALSTRFDGARALITGGLGFIGSNLAGRLVALGAKVVLIDSLIPEYGGNLFNIRDCEGRLTVNIADVRDQHGINYLVQGHDYLFNLAGQTSHVDSMVDPFTDLEINSRSQLSILEACRKNNPNIRIVFASTRQIYGRPQYLPVDERHPLVAADVNGINKIAGEMYHALYSRVYGIKTCSLRLTNTYGPRMRVKDARQTFLGIWIRRVIEDKPFDIFGDGKQLRDFNYVDDVVDALLLAASHDHTDGCSFNLGSEERISLKDLADLLISVNARGEYRIVPFPPDRKAIDIGDYYGDFSSFEHAVGWRPQVGLKEGLARTLDYYHTHWRMYWEAEG